ncbi:hypothetical protein B0H12DRAFT_1013263, partial [Mycena haematopus]
QAYRIRVVHDDAPTFFEMPALPPPAVQHPAILALSGPTAATDPYVYEFLRAMDEAMLTADAAADFAVLLLRYAPVGRLIRTRKHIPLLVCGETRHATADVRHAGIPQLIAEAVAAFYSNNMTREQVLAVPPLPSKVVPGITIKGTSPIFFKIPATQELVAAVMGGVYPSTDMIVHAHLPVIPSPVRRLDEGMKPLDNRLVIMSCFEAFKQFVH